MDNKEKVSCHGSVQILHRNANGDVSVTRKDNLILNVGFDFICNSIGDTINRPNVMSHIALGTGTTAPVATQAALENELFRKVATYTHTAGTKVMRFSTYFPPGEATGALTEAGVCNSTTNAIFIDRVTFDVINKASDDEVTVNFEFTLS